MNKDILLIHKSGLFDYKYYLSQFDYNIKHPILHYLTEGWKQNKNPCPEFNSINYLETNIDAKISGINPFIYWIKYEKLDKTKNNVQINNNTNKKKIINIENRKRNYMKTTLKNETNIKKKSDNEKIKQIINNTNTYTDICSICTF